MKAFKFFILLIGLSSCAPRIIVPELAGSRWRLSEWPGNQIPESAEARIEFKNDRELSGKSFCNGFGGTYTIAGEKIKFGPLIGTKMWCEPVGESENLFLKQLSETDKVQTRNGNLILMRGEEILMIFSPAPPAS